MTRPSGGVALATPDHAALHNAHIDVQQMYGLTKTAVQDAAAAASAQGGGTLYFAAGTYTWADAAFSSLSKLTFIGEPGAIIRSNGGANPPIATFTSCNDIRVQGLTFDANGTTTFGGVKFYDCARVWVEGNRYYDSNQQAPTGSDIYSFVFTKNTTNNTDIYVIGNIIEDLQLEVDHCTRATIAHNKVYRADATAGIGVFSTATGTPSVSDYLIHDNLLVDCNASAGAITVDVDPVATNNCSFKRFNIHNNTILFTGATTPKKAMLVGTTDNSIATTGNVFTDFHVHDNTVVYAGGAFSDSAILFNSSVTSAFTFERCTVNNNKLYGTGAGVGIDVRKFNSGAVTGNLVQNFTTTVNAPSGTSTYVNDIDSSGNPHFTTPYVDTTLFFGTAGDTNLYRSAANKLKTDDVMIVSGDGSTLGALQVGAYVGTAASSTGIGAFGDSEFSGKLTAAGDLKHTGTKAGFYNTTPIVKQTGVAVTAAAVHAALVNLGLISP